MTTISSDTQDACWNCAITLRVRNPTEAALEITIWDREYYLGEALLRVEGLLGYQGAQPPVFTMTEKNALENCHLTPNLCMVKL